MSEDTNGGATAPRAGVTDILWLLFTLGSSVYVGSLIASFLAWLMLD